MEFSYEQIKQLAKETRCKVTDLIALASQNDPFYQGTPATRALAEWFTEIYYRQGWQYIRNHIRRCHYQIVSLEAILPNGKPYENTMECWDTLLIATKAARYLGLVDMASFDDQRNGKPMSYLVNQQDPEISVDEEYFPDLPAYTVYEYQAAQRYHIELWCEKTTANDVLLPLCERYGAVLQTGAGELSITAAWLLAQRLKKHERPARVFYISDFDPAGQSMPVAIARKLEYFVRNEGIEADVRLFPIVLTAEQVSQYRLPRTPIKATEQRGKYFEDRYGEGAVELDALEALQPGELERIVRSHIERYYDADMAAKTREGRAQIERELRSIRQRVLEQHRNEIDLANQQLEQIQNLWQAIREELSDKTPDLNQYPLPEAREADEIGQGLYNSQRDYLEQIDAYKAFQGRCK